MTAQYRPRQIALGDHVEWDGATCTVQEVSKGMIHLRAPDGVLYAVLPTVLAASVYASGQLKGPRRPPLDDLDLIRIGGLGCLPVKAREDALWRRGHVLEILTGQFPDAEGEADSRYSLTRTREERLEAKSLELKISVRTLKRWLSAFAANGIGGLVDKRATGLTNPLANADPRLLDAMRTVLASGEKVDSTGGMTRFLRRTKRELDEEHGNDVVQLPPPSTLHRFATVMIAGTHQLKDATTRRSMASVGGSYKGAFRTSRPGEVVVFDTTRLDVLALDPLTGLTTAVELTLSMDLYTRSICAWRFTPAETNRVDATLVLADTLTPEPMRPGWPEWVRYSAYDSDLIELACIDERLAGAAAKPVIVPETILIDHGKIYMSEAFQAGCLHIGASVQPARKYKGNDKPVERLFGTIRTQFSEHCAGFKGRNTANRGEDIEGKAVWTIAELDMAFGDWVVLKYQPGVHSGLKLPQYPGLKLSPNDMFSEAIARAGYFTLPPDQDLYFEMLPIAWAKIRRDGVAVKGLQYRGEGLYPYEEVKSPYMARKGKWPIRYDPRNRNLAYFFDPEPVNGGWKQLKWVAAHDGLEPFTDRTLLYVKQVLARRGRSPEHQDEIADLLRELQNGLDLKAAAAAAVRRRRLRDAARAEEVARDRRTTSLGPIGGPSEPDLKADEEEDDDEDFAIDFDLIEPYELFDDDIPEGGIA